MCNILILVEFIVNMTNNLPLILMTVGVLLMYFHPIHPHLQYPINAAGITKLDIAVLNQYQNQNAFVVHQKILLQHVKTKIMVAWKHLTDLVAVSILPTLAWMTSKS
jgi:hypothetical protein